MKENKFEESFSILKNKRFDIDWHCGGIDPSEYGGYIKMEDVEKHCLDKQKVLEAINNRNMLLFANKFENERFALEVINGFIVYLKEDLALDTSAEDLNAKNSTQEQTQGGSPSCDSKETDSKFNKTIDEMTSLAEKFYPMTDSERDSFKEEIGSLFGKFINDCENQEEAN